MLVTLCSENLFPLQLLGAFFIGYLLTQIPSGLLAEKVGGKAVVVGGFLAAAAANLAFPFVVGEDITMGVIVR